MLSVTPEQIREIAEQMDCGHRCFVNIESLKLIFIPNADDIDLEETGAWQSELAELEKNGDSYYEIERMRSRDSYRVMEGFIETLDNSSRLKFRLLESIGKRKPFSQFKSVIDNAGEYRQLWFDYKAQKTRDWVAAKLEDVP